MPVYKDKKKDTYYFKCSINDHQFLRRGFLSLLSARRGEIMFIAETTGNKSSFIPTFKELVGQYFNREKMLVKESTYIHRKSDIDAHILNDFPDIRADKLVYSDFMAWRSMIARLHLSRPNDFLKYLQAIFSFCSVFYGYDCRYVKMLPPFKDYSFGIDKIGKKSKILSYSDFKKFISVINDEKFKLLFVTAYITGMRIGEIRGLQVESLKDGRLYIYQAANSKLRKGHSVLVSPKTKDSFRFYLLPDFLNQNLIDYIKSSGLSSKSFLFPSSDDHSCIIGETTVNRYLKSYCVKAGIASLNFHMFRHTEATLLSEAGIDPKIIAGYLGHSSEKVTEKYYIHESDDKRQSVADLLGKKFGDDLK